MEQYGSLWVSAVGESSPTLEDLQQHIDEWTEAGWYVVGYHLLEVKRARLLDSTIGVCARWRR
jgi:hypothetical protein